MYVTLSGKMYQRYLSYMYVLDLYQSGLEYLAILAQYSDRFSNTGNKKTYHCVMWIISQASGSTLCQVHYVLFLLDQTDYQIDYPADDQTDYIDYDNYIYVTQSKFLKKKLLCLVTHFVEN